jgi:hypothetical protein
MRSKLLFISVITVSCGQQQAQPETLKSDNQQTTQDNYLETREYALKVDNKRDVPSCNDDNAKQLVYVVETAEMLTCEKHNWVAIDLQGKPGADGKAGRDGKDGQDGQQGIAGRDGIDGLAGQDGSNGIDGVAGTNGVDAANINVLNPDGSVLGSLIDIYVVNNEYYVLTPTGLRLQYEHSTGALRNVYLVFSGLNCAGTARIMIENGVFGNVFVDGRDNATIYKTTGHNLGTFAYQSRIPKATTCQNASGSILRSHAYEQVTLSNYPLTNTEIENGTN